MEPYLLRQSRHAEKYARKVNKSGDRAGPLDNHASQKGENMKINFSKDQFETLLKTLYLGIWMANATMMIPRIARFLTCRHTCWDSRKDFRA